MTSALMASVIYVLSALAWMALGFVVVKEFLKKVSS